MCKDSVDILSLCLIARHPLHISDEILRNDHCWLALYTPESCKSASTERDKTPSRYVMVFRNFTCVSILHYAILLGLKRVETSSRLLFITVWLMFT